MLALWCSYFHNVLVNAMSGNVDFVDDNGGLEGFEFYDTWYARHQCHGELCDLTSRPGCLTGLSLSWMMSSSAILMTNTVSGTHTTTTQNFTAISTTS